MVLDQPIAPDLSQLIPECASKFPHQISRGSAGMLKKYLAKFAVDILPSVAATVIGAYIVNHYIVSKPGPGAPVASAVSTVDPKAAPEAAKVDGKADVKADGRTADRTSAEIVNTRGPGVTARGISERAILEKAAAEKAQEKQEKQDCLLYTSPSPRD